MGKGGRRGRPGRRRGRRGGIKRHHHHHRRHHHHHAHHHVEPPKPRYRVEVPPAAPAGLPTGSGAQWRNAVAQNQADEMGSFSVGPLQFRRDGPARPPHVPPGGEWQHARFENHLKMCAHCC